MKTTSRRDVFANKVVATIDANADLIEARFTLEKSIGSDWITEIRDALRLSVLTSGQDNDRQELQKETLLQNLGHVVQESLSLFGLEDESPEITRLMRGVLVTQLGRSIKGSRSQALTAWMYGSLSSSTLVVSPVISVPVSRDDFEAMQKTPSAGAERLLTTLNAGNAHSRISEAYAFEWLYVALAGRIELLKTELEIEYSIKGDITDFSITTLDDRVIGVSVTRACGGDFAEMEAQRLANKKMEGRE